MFIYYHMIDVDEALEMEQVISKRLKTDIVFVETLAQCFQKKLKKNVKNNDLRINLISLIHDLNYLKQFIDG